MSGNPFLNLLGFAGPLTGSVAYVSTGVPKLVSKHILYISIPDIGSDNTQANNSRPFTFLVVADPGLQTVMNTNDTFDNKFMVSGNK